jgi:hypothetical protein
MTEDRSKGLWARLKDGIDWRLRRPKEDAAGTDAGYDGLDVLAPLDGEEDGPYSAEADDGAKQRAEFSQHISC